MEIGIFAKVWVGRDLDEILRLMTRFGIRHTQFNTACVGLSSMPERIPPDLARRVRDSLDRRGVEMVAVSGTFNMIHPDRTVIADGMRRLGVLAGACHLMGTNVITLCTGSRDPRDMWRRHPENDSLEAWNDLLDAMEQALATAEAEEVTLAVEPEQANVINSARKARKLLDHFHSPRLKIILDPANLFDRQAPAEIERIVDEAFDLLGDETVIAHAKDRDPGGVAVPAGHGVLDYDHYLDCLRGAGFGGTLVLHGLSENEVQGCVSFLREKMLPR
jgi:sugar phosphate isomerase/epimerase